MKKFLTSFMVISSVSLLLKDVLSFLIRTSRKKRRAYWLLLSLVTSGYSVKAIKISLGC